MKQESISRVGGGGVTVAVEEATHVRWRVEGIGKDKSVGRPGWGVRDRKLSIHEEKMGHQRGRRRERSVVGFEVGEA